MLFTSHQKNKRKRAVGAVGQPPLRSVYQPVQDELADVEERLRSPEALEGIAGLVSLNAGTARSIEEMERYIIEAGGKRLRAALTLLSAKLCGAPAERAVPLAVSIELFHTASLVIDDMMVDARMRRSKPTVHRKWDESGALSAALGLQLRAVPSFLQALQGSDDAGALISLVGQTATRVLWGAILQHRQRMNFDLTEEEYMEIIEHKTASLFEACTEGGAILAGKLPRQRTPLRKYGYHLGRAFQLTDDFLDFVGSPHVLGKSPGSDLAEGRSTLPMIHFQKNASAKNKAAMKKLLPPLRKSPLPNDEIVWMLNAEGSLVYCSEMASAESAKARKSLGKFPNTPEKESMLIIALMASERKV